MALQFSPAQLEVRCQESQQSSLLAMQWSFTIIALVIISLRLYCRKKFGKGLCWDDYIFFTGAIIGLPGPFLARKWVHTGLGKHIECLGPDRASATVQWSIASQAVHIVCLGFVKVSLCLCVLRVIDRVERRIAIFLWANITLVGAIHVAQLAMLLAECRPLNALWSPKVHGSCYSPTTVYTTTYVAFSLDAFTDLVCSGIPIFVIYRMQMNTRTKVALCVLMGLGVFTAMGAAVEATTVKEIWSKDFTWNEVVLVNWACAEQALSLILVSLPFLRPLFCSFFTLNKPGRSPPEPPTKRSRSPWKPPPDYSLFKSTNNSNSLHEWHNVPYPPIEGEDAHIKFLQIPLAAYHFERLAELNVRVKYDDLERGQGVGP